MATETKVQHIYEALISVQGEIVKLGIAKERTNEQQHFTYRAIDQFMNRLSPLHAKHGVVLLPRYTDCPDIERVTKAGATLIHSQVIGEFTLVSAKDGSSVTVTTIGTGMDSGDKGKAKAQTSSLKTCLTQLYLVPTEGLEDADATTPDPSVPKPPAGFEEWFVDLDAVADTGYDPLAAAWRQSPVDLRNYTLKFRKPEWDAKKARATAVTKAKKEAAAAAGGK